MSDYLELPIGEKTPDIVTAIIEIPQDGVNKYEYDRALHVFRLDRNLHSPCIIRAITASSHKPSPKTAIRLTS